MREQKRGVMMFERPRTYGIFISRIVCLLIIRLKKGETKNAVQVLTVKWTTLTNAGVDVQILSVRETMMESTYISWVLVNQLFLNKNWRSELQPKCGLTLKTCYKCCRNSMLHNFTKFYKVLWFYNLEKGSTSV